MFAIFVLFLKVENLMGLKWLSKVLFFTKVWRFKMKAFFLIYQRPKSSLEVSVDSSYLLLTSRHHNQQFFSSDRNRDGAENPKVPYLMHIFPNLNTKFNSAWLTSSINVSTDGLPLLEDSLKLRFICFVPCIRMLIILICRKLMTAFTKLDALTSNSST